MAKANGFKTLRDILDSPLHELPFKPQSGYRMLKELLDILEASSLSTLVEEEQRDWEETNVRNPGLPID